VFTLLTVSKCVRLVYGDKTTKHDEYDCNCLVAGTNCRTLRERGVGGRYCEM
jgi:hypothetical protein